MLLQVTDMSYFHYFYSECFEISMIYQDFILEDLTSSFFPQNRIFSAYESNTCLLKNKSILTSDPLQSECLCTTCCCWTMPMGMSWSTYPESLPASWPCAQTEPVCRYYQPDTTVPTVLLKSGELKTQLLNLKVRKHEPQISQNIIMNSMNIINLKHIYF